MNDLSLGEALPKEIERCEELVKQYEQLGFIGMFGRLVISHDIKLARDAIADNDIARMVICYQILKACK